MAERIGRLWCRFAHTKAMWPVHGKYICPQCLREHRVYWEEGPAEAPVASGKAGSDYRVSAAATVAN